ncbi:hypothetical protein ACIRQQ_22500 [Streptomyces fuscichromogenes]|uniref:hypothetical protein n=1 Tax=Streptomyces fuscichromogenes TaxID=1324013 RepID=UPI00382E326A
MITPFDDYPIHQTPVPVAHAGGGHPNHYDRYFFNGYTEDMYFAVALGLYPNRGVIDAAFSVVRGGEQRSVFASGRIPLDRTQTRIGPISVEVVEPLRTVRVYVDAPEHGLRADLVAHTRTAVAEEPRSTVHNGTQVVMDTTRATQLVRWSGDLSVAGQPVDLRSVPVYGTKDRSWGVRALGDPVPAAPTPDKRQIFFLWAPLHFEDRCLHYLVYENADGHPWLESAAELDVLDADAPRFGPDAGIRHLGGVRHKVSWTPGLRKSKGATLTLDGDDAPIELEPLVTFRMRGIGYRHPVWTHGRWHDELAVGGEVVPVEDLDRLSPDCFHLQQVVRATWGKRTGIGVLEQLLIGPYHPGGWRGLTDGAPDVA